MKEENIEFYTVIANFDMSTYSEVNVKSFLLLQNAEHWAMQEKYKFLNDIHDELDEEESEQKNDELFYFYGVSQNGENFVTIQVEKKTFEDNLVI